jgi:F0F1-type ATP synthase epsilon subunit
MKEEFLEVKLFWLPIVAEIFFEGKAKSVSSKNKLGKFDVLPSHTNFITLISKNLTIITDKNKKIAYQFERGVLEVSTNKVNIFLGL